MQIDIINSGKDTLDVSLDNGTVAEVARVYLNEDSDVKKAVWKRKHISKPVHMKIETKSKTPKKVVGDAVSAISKDLDTLAKLK
jgi:DNA-directed RNA polymerase subunit L